ncbi:FHA domain-containing protein, partial [Psychrobacter immobilis]|uniref:FHA domain-containing protein n=1 Tax=Psychrobacter immobilis TaxID=498 RepID=UPI001D129B7C
MVNNMDSTDRAVEKGTWQLNALTEALGDLTLTINDSLSVGRGNDNDVVLGSKEVSRNHAVLSTLNGQLYVKDLDSSNGTFINDERIEGNKSSLLQVDDTIGFASFSFQVVVPTADGGNEEPIVEEPIVEEPIVEEPIVEEPIVEEPIVEEPIVEEPIVEEPIVEEPIVEEP